MTTEVLLGPQAVPQPPTHPVSMQARHTNTALFDATDNSFLAQTPWQFFTLLSILLLMPPAIFIFLISFPPPLLLTNTNLNWFSSYPFSRFFSASIFFFFSPNAFFSATPTRFFSWLPPTPLAYSTFQSLMTFNNHLYEPEAFVPESCSSSNHMAIWRASAKAMKSKKHVQAGPRLRSIGHIFAGRTANRVFLWVYTNQVSPFLCLFRHHSLLLVFSTIFEL